MANGVSGTRGGAAAKINMNDSEREYFLNSDNAAGLVGPYRDYMKQRGFTEEEAQEVRDLLNAHGGSSYQQEIADKKIVDELEAGTRLGQALEAKMDFEEALYKEWVKYKASTEAPWLDGVYNGDKAIYRKGNRKDGVEAWTRDEDGANMGGGGIGYDYKSTIGTLFKEGYRLLGGFGLMTGAPGENEVTFVKYKKLKK